MADYKLINGRISDTLAGSTQNGTSAKNRGNNAPKHKSKRQGGSQKSCQGILIHVNGDRDELSDIDQSATLAELELKLLSERHDMSRIQQSNRNSGGAVSRASRMPEVEGTRARPMKAHENEPFLTVGAVNVKTNYGNKTPSYTSQVKPPARDPRLKLTPRKLESRPSSRSNSQCDSRPASSNRPLSSTSHSSHSSLSHSVGSQSARSPTQRPSSKMYVSPNSTTPRPNPRIKMPFKHNIRKPSECQTQEPSQELKELTALATHHVNRVLSGDGGTSSRRQRGQLCKGKLKPLYPVTVSGPSIQQCRGILSETRIYSPSASRTLQRRRHIMSQLRSGEIGLNGKPSHYPLGGSESVHRVSAASSMEDLTEVAGVKDGNHGDDFQAELACMEQDAIFSQELEEKMSFNKEMSSMSREDNHADQACTPMSLDQRIGNLQNPDFSTPHPPPAIPTPTSQGQESMEVSRDAKSQGQGQGQAGVVAREILSWKEPASPDRAESRGSSGSRGGCRGNGLVNNANNNFQVEGGGGQAALESKRPQSASVQYDHQSPPRPPRKARPKTVASHKAVRFAEHIQSSDGTSLPLTGAVPWTKEGVVGSRARGLQTQKTYHLDIGSAHLDKGSTPLDKSPAPLDKGSAPLVEGSSPLDREPVPLEKSAISRQTCKPWDLNGPGTSKPKDDDDDDESDSGCGDSGSQGNGTTSRGGRQASSSTMATQQDGESGCKSEGSQSRDCELSEAKEKSDCGSNSEGSVAGEVYPFRAGHTPQGAAKGAGQKLTRGGEEAVSMATEIRERGEESLASDDQAVQDAPPWEVGSQDTMATSDWLTASDSSMPASMLDSLTRTSDISSGASLVHLPQLSWSSIIGSKETGEEEDDGTESSTDAPPSPVPVHVPWGSRAASWEGRVPPPATSVPDQASLLKLLLEVEAQVEGEEEGGVRQSDSLHSLAAESTSDPEQQASVLELAADCQRPQQKTVKARSFARPMARASESGGQRWGEGVESHNRAASSLSQASCSSWITVHSGEGNPNPLVPRSTPTPQQLRRNRPRLSRHGRTTASPVTALPHRSPAINPRVGMVVCKHDASAPKEGGKSEAGEDGTQGGQTPDEDGKPLGLEWPRGDEAGEDFVQDGHHCSDDYGNQLTQLFTHFSLGGPEAQRPPALASDWHRTCNDIVCRNLRVPGILKKKKKPAAARSKGTPSRSKAGGHQLGEPTHIVSKPVPKRQMFTHHSKRPFVYPTNDPVSNTVATRLKFGDSPYLKDLKLPSKRRVRGKLPDTARACKLEPKATGSEEQAGGSPRKPTKQVSQNSPQRQARVKFASCSLGTVDVNQNCYEDDCDFTFLTQGTSLDGAELGLTSHRWSAMGIGEIEDDDDDDEEGEELAAGLASEDMDAQFLALERELSAVRSELRLKILDSQAEQLLEGGMDDSSSVAASGGDCVNELSASEDYEDDDDYVYEDDGTSEEEEEEEVAKPGPESSASREEGTGVEGDDDSYSTYYRDLLLDYRRKCMSAGAGNLVISDRLTWPGKACQVTNSNITPTATATAGDRSAARSAQDRRARPYSAGAFRTMSDRSGSPLGHKGSRKTSLDGTDSGLVVGSRPASQCDSGWESDADRASSSKGWQDRPGSRLSMDGESLFSEASGAGGAKVASQAETAVRVAGRPTSAQIGTGTACRPPSGREEHPNLKIVASSVPKTPARTSTPPSAPVAPFPPLCFTVNARPPPGSLFFFAYSTYMSADRLGSLLQAKIDKRYWAVLLGFDLTFNKKGSEETQGGLANIVFNPFSSVEGCIFVLTPAQLQQLDAFTGAPQHYARVVLPVWMSEVSGSADDLGLARYCVPAVTYIAQDDWTLDDGSVPNEFMASQCLRSADLLTANYRSKLQSLVAADSTSSPPCPAPLLVSECC